jgi:hypothetical protein
MDTTMSWKWIATWSCQAHSWSSTSLAHYAGYVTEFAPNRLTYDLTQHNGQGFDYSIVQNIIHFTIDFVPCAHLRKFLPLEHSEEQITSTINGYGNMANTKRLKVAKQVWVLMPSSPACFPHNAWDKLSQCNSKTQKLNEEFTPTLWTSSAPLMSQNPDCSICSNAQYWQFIQYVYNHGHLPLPKNHLAGTQQ